MEDNTKSVGPEENEERIKGSSELCSAQGIKKLKLRMVKKRVHKSKHLNNSMNSSALRLLNTSANRSLLHRKTLTANNRDLARTLEAAKNDNRLLREINIELHQENQSQAAQLANLRRVAGLKDEDINREVVHRMDSKMREMKSILQKLSEQLVTAGMTMGDAFDCCLSSCRPSMGEGRPTISPMRSRSSTEQGRPTISPVPSRSSTGQSCSTISPVHGSSSTGMLPECKSPKRISLSKDTSLSSYNVQQNERPCDLSVIVDMSILTADADTECIDAPISQLATMDEIPADNDDSVKPDSNRKVKEQQNYPTVTNRPRSRRRKSNHQTPPKDDYQDLAAAPEVSIADEVAKYVSKERRGTFVVSKPVCEVDSEAESKKTRSLRRGTYFVPAPVNDYLDVENIMNEPSDILVNDDDVPSISLESKEINSKSDCPTSTNSLDKHPILSFMQVNVSDYNSCAKILGADLIDEDATVYLNADMEMTSVIDNNILLQPEYLKPLPVQQNESKTIESSKEPQSEFVIPTIKCSESSESKKMSNISVPVSRIGKSNKTTNNEVRPAASIEHKESTGNKGKCHIEATHSTVSEANGKKQQNVDDEKRSQCAGSTIEMKQVKPGKFVFAASRKNANGIRSAIPKKIPIKNKESKLKPIPTTPAKLISIFDFHDKTPQVILDTPQDNKTTETSARSTLAALREQSDYVKKDQQQGNGSGVGEHENTSNKKGVATDTYYLPLKTDSPSKNEVTKRNRSKSRCKDGDDRSRSRSRPRKATEDEDYDPSRKARSRKRTGKATSSDVTEDECSSGPGRNESSVPTRISARSKQRTVNYQENNDNSLIEDEDSVTDTTESIPTVTQASQSKADDAAGQTFATVESKDGKDENILEAAANIYYLPLKDSSPSPSRGTERSRPTEPGEGASRRTRSTSRAKATANEDEECDAAAPPGGCMGRERSQPTDSAKRARSRSRAKAITNQDAECDTAAPPDGCNEKQGEKTKRGRSKSGSRSEKMPIRSRSKSGSRLEKRNSENVTATTTVTDQSEGIVNDATSNNPDYDSRVSSRSKRRKITQPDEKRTEDSNETHFTSKKILKTDDVTKEKDTTSNKGAKEIVYCLPLKDSSPPCRGRSKSRRNNEESRSRSKSRAKATNSEMISHDNEKNDHKSRVRSKSKTRKGKDEMSRSKQIQQNKSTVFSEKSNEIDAVVSIDVDECVSKEGQENSAIKIKKFLSVLADNGSDSDFQSKNKRMRSKSRSHSSKRVAIQEFFSSDEEDLPNMNLLPKSESKSESKNKKPRKDDGGISNAGTNEGKRTSRNKEQISSKLSLLDVDDVNIMEVVPPTPQLAVRKSASVQSAITASAKSPQPKSNADLTKKKQKLRESNDKENNTAKDTDLSRKCPKTSGSATLDNIKKKLARIQDKMSKEAASSDHERAVDSATQHPLKDINAAERLSVDSASGVFSDRPRRAATNVVSYKLPGLGSKLRRGDKFFLTEDDVPKSPS